MSRRNHLTLGSQAARADGAVIFRGFFCARLGWAPANLRQLDASNGRQDHTVFIAEPEGSSCIVQAVVNIAAERHMTTTAEGVETERQRDLLRELGCSEMQGYLFSAPKPAAEVRPMLFADRRGPEAARTNGRKPLARTACGSLRCALRRASGRPHDRYQTARYARRASK
jgi:hypothetical protein